MYAIAYLSFLVSLAGLLIYVLASTNAKVMEVGRLMFATGLLAFLLETGTHLALRIGT